MASSSQQPFIRKTRVHHARPGVIVPQNRSKTFKRIAESKEEKTLPVPVELDGKVRHDLKGLVRQYQIHGNGAHLAAEGSGDLQTLRLHSREPDLRGHN